jgi:hypothetical protein
VFYTQARQVHPKNVIGQLCLIQVTGSAVAAIAVWVSVKAIVSVGPALAMLG